MCLVDCFLHVTKSCIPFSYSFVFPENLLAMAERTETSELGLQSWFLVSHKTNHAMSSGIKFICLQLRPFVSIQDNWLKTTWRTLPLKRWVNCSTTSGSALELGTLIGNLNVLWPSSLAVALEFNLSGWRLGGGTCEEHNFKLKAFFERRRQLNVSLNRGKCAWICSTPRLTWLGYVIEINCLRPRKDVGSPGM